MKQKYLDFNFRKESLRLIELMNTLIMSYQRQGFKLTVRQLYYQLVAREIIENNEKSYKRIVSLINDARLDGLIDWDAIEDRTRDIVSRPHWDSGQQILEACAPSFHMDMWDNQESRTFVVVEKEALVGVLSGVCRQNDVPLLAARGYPSVTVVRELALQFFLPAMRAGQVVNMLHLGDHDPSGIDMTRDLEDRIKIFLEGEDIDFHLNRLALNMPQIEELKPPPNPAKTTDARFKEYRKKFGEESWELDALEPRFLVGLVQSNIDNWKDEDKWQEKIEEIDSVKAKLRKVADDFTD